MGSKWDRFVDGFFEWFMVGFIVMVMGMMCSAPDLPDGMKTFLVLDCTFLALCATPDVHILG